MLDSSAPTCSLMEAAALLGISRNVAYSLAATGAFPVRALRIGRQYRVPVADLRRYLGLPIEPTANPERVAG